MGNTLGTSARSLGPSPWEDEESEEEEYIERKDEAELFFLPSSRLTRRSPLLKEAMLLQEEEKSTSQKSPPLYSSITKKTKVATEPKDDEAEEPPHGSEALREIMPLPTYGQRLFHLEFPPLDGVETEESSSEESELEFSDSASRYLAPIGNYSSPSGEIANCESIAASRHLTLIDDHSSQSGELTDWESNSASRLLAPINGPSLQTGESEGMWHSWEESAEHSSHRSQITFQPGECIIPQPDLEVTDRQNEETFENFHELSVFSLQDLKIILGTDQIDFSDPESLQNLTQVELKSEATNLPAWGEFSLLSSENRAAAKARARDSDSHLDKNTADRVFLHCPEKMATFSPVKPLTDEEKKLFPNGPVKEGESSEEPSQEASPEESSSESPAASPTTVYAEQVFSDAQRIVDEAKQADAALLEGDDDMDLENSQASDGLGEEDENANTNAQKAIVGATVSNQKDSPVKKPPKQPAKKAKKADELPARAALREKKLPSAHIALLRHAELNHVQFDAKKKLSLDDIAFQSGKMSDGASSAEAQKELLEKAEAGHSKIKELLVGDKKKDKELREAMKRQMHTFAKLLPPPVSFFKHDEKTWVPHACPASKRKQDAMSQEDEKLRCDLFAAQHHAYADSALAFVPADEFVQAAGAYGYYGEDIKSFHSFQVLHKAGLLAAPFSIYKKRLEKPQEQSKLERIHDLVLDVTKDLDHSDPKLIELLRILGCAVMGDVDLHCTERNADSTSSHPQTAVATPSGGKRRRDESLEENPGIKQRLGERPAKKKPTVQRKATEPELRKLCDTVRSLASLSGDDRKKYAPRVQHLASQLGVHQGLLSYRAEEDTSKIVTPLEILMHNVPGRYAEYMGVEEDKASEGRRLQYIARDLAREPLAVLSKHDSVALVCPICQQTWLIRPNGKARFWRDNYDIVKEDLLKHLKLEHKDKDFKPRKGLPLSTVATPADLAKEKRRKK